MGLALEGQSDLCDIASGPSIILFILSVLRGAPFFNASEEPKVHSDPPRVWSPDHFVHLELESDRQRVRDDPFRQLLS